VNDPSKAPQNDKVVAFPDAEEKARRLRIEVERLAKLPIVEWMYYLETGEVARKYGIEPAKLKHMIEAVIRANDKKAREDRGKLRYVKKQRDAARREGKRKQETQRTR
jgi:hypothetical protein